NGPQFTTIDGGHSVRCVYLTNSTLLSGFTLANGLAGYGRYGYGGGALLCQSVTAVVSNCVLVGNFTSSPYTEGGGANGGTLNNCLLSGNSAYYGGGGAAYCTLNNCTLIGNGAGGNGPEAYGYGGGAYACTLNNCTLTGNSVSGAYAEGGGAYSCN